MLSTIRRTATTVAALGALERGGDGLAGRRVGDARWTTAPSTPSAAIASRSGRSSR